MAHRMPRTVLMIILWGASAPHAASAQTCPPIPSGTTQSADLSIKTENGSCTVEASDDGGYIRLNTVYRGMSR
jgi:hypothetical protein